MTLDLSPSNALITARLVVDATSLTPKDRLPENNVTLSETIFFEYFAFPRKILCEIRRVERKRRKNVADRKSPRIHWSKFTPCQVPTHKTQAHTHCVPQYGATKNSNLKLITVDRSLSTPSIKRAACVNHSLNLSHTEVRLANGDSRSSSRRVHTIRFFNEASDTRNAKEGRQGARELVFTPTKRLPSIHERSHVQSLNVVGENRVVAMHPYSATPRDQINVRPQFQKEKFWTANLKILTNQI